MLKDSDVRLTKASIAEIQLLSKGFVTVFNQIAIYGDNICPSKLPATMV